MERLYILVATVACLVAIGNASNKRIVLSSEDDLRAAIIQLREDVAQLKASSTSTPASTNGATYTRWGRTSCPGNGTEFIYAGYMAGSQWNQPGGSASNLCLPHHPTWGQYVDGQNGGSIIMGSEIEDADNVASKLLGHPVNNNDLPCAVCQSPRSTQRMFPAQTDCYPGWTKEYDGYLVASHHTWQGSADYACLDSQPDFIVDRGDDNHVVMLVEASCGSLACPPYVEGRELACVVCSK